MTFEIKKTIRFADCDPAAIVFYPRYFEMINETVEDWFRLVLGQDFLSLTQKQNRGVPLVRIEVDFMLPGRLYDEITLRLQPTKIGTSSLSLSIVGQINDRDALKANLVLAHINLLEKTSMPFSPELKKRLQELLECP